MKFKKMNQLKGLGFSLVEVMVAMGLMVAGMTAMMKVSDLQSQSNVRLIELGEAMLLTKEVQVLLEDSFACRNSILSGTGSNTPSTLAQLDQNLNTLYDTQNQLKFSSSSAYGKKILNYNISRAQFGSYTTLPVGDGDFAFNIILQITTSSSSINLIRKVDQPIYVSVTGGVITDCLTPMARTHKEMKKEVCEGLGGVFGDVANGVWCTLAGKALTNPVRLDSDTLHSHAALALDLSHNYKAPYLEVGSSGMNQDINGSLFLTDLPGPAGVYLNWQHIGPYDSVGFSELSAFNHRWFVENISSMLQHYDVGANLAECSATAGEVLILSDGNPGVNCVNVKDKMRCPLMPSGVPQYLKGFQSNGEALCAPLIVGNTPCQNGGELAVNTAGSVIYRCCGAPGSTCSPCTPTAGSWVATGASSCDCSGIETQTEICQNTSCGGTCSGGANEGDTRIATISTSCIPSGSSGTCTIPCQEGASCTSNNSCGIGTCVGASSSGSCSNGPPLGYCPQGCSTTISCEQHTAAQACTGSSYCGSSGCYNCDWSVVTTPGTCSCSGSGVSCPSGVAKYKDYDKCCPASYPDTGTSYACCQNSAGVEICL